MAEKEHLLANNTRWYNNDRDRESYSNLGHATRSVGSEATSGSSGRFGYSDILSSNNSTVNSDATRSFPGLYEDDGLDELELSSTDDTSVLQAIVFIEDAIYYRSCHHKVDLKTLRYYRLYYSTFMQFLLYFFIFLLHILAFFEQPSSIVENWTSDIRYQGARWVPPCGLMESIELICLLVLAFDFFAKSYFIGKKRVKNSRWLLVYITIIAISLIDWCVTVGYGCNETVRFRRILRPFFLIQNSSLMKKTMNCLRRTIPQVVSVLMLLALHIYFFTLLGMLLFPKSNIHKNGNSSSVNSYSGSIGFQNISDNVIKEDDYFVDLLSSFMSLLVLLTTANNPDITMPAYKVNRFYAIYFVVFLMIGLYCFMNMLTAVIYNQFRGYFQDSIQSSLFRRRVGIRAAFEVLRRKSLRHQRMSSSQLAGVNFRSPLTVVSEGVPTRLVRSIIDKTNLKKKEKNAIAKALLDSIDKNLDATSFQEAFCVLEKNYDVRNKPQIVWTRRPCLNVLQTIVSHQWFTYFGCIVGIVNVICISVELDGKYDDKVKAEDLTLGVINLVFIVYYMIELALKLWALGWRLYMWELANVFDGFITILLVLIEVLYLAFGTMSFGPNKPKVEPSLDTIISLWDLVRIINILILIRLFRIITAIKTMSIVANTLWDLVRNLKPFGGILVVIYYSYAILGMELFQGTIKYPANSTNITYKCGTYQQLDYWANNFDDFAASLILLWDIMVVNNWHVFLRVYSEALSPWSMVYFVVWWLLSVILVLNLFTALILENFIMRWDQKRERSSSGNEYNSSLSVHDMFRGGLREPAENEVLLELRHHEHLNIER